MDINYRNTYRAWHRLLRADNTPLEKPLQPPNYKGLLCLISIIIILMSIFLFQGCARATEASYAGYTLNQWANAVHHAEGNDNYGILSISCTKGEGCRRICKNTVRHNYKRWQRSQSHKPFLLFLQHRYCPVGASNDPTGLNRAWAYNVGYWLRKG